MKIRVEGHAANPSEHPPPGERGGTSIVQPGRVRPPGLPVYLAAEPLAGMFAYADRGGEYEVGGFLLGGYHHWEGRRYVDVTVQVPALKAKSARTHLTFSHEAQREFHAVAGRDHPGVLVLGWYHTHPGYGVFLSEYDLFIQRGFFDAEHHVALVIDPFQHSLLDRVGVFVWERGEVSRGYHPVVYEG